MSKTQKDTIPTADAPPRRLPWTRIAILVVFGLFSVYDLFEAISSIFLVTDQIAAYNAAVTELGLNEAQVPWVLLIGSVVVPLATFVTAVLLGRRHGLGVAALLLLVGLAVSAALTLSLTALA